MPIVTGYVPGIGETDPQKLARSIRNLYEYLTASGVTSLNGQTGDLWSPVGNAAGLQLSLVSAGGAATIAMKTVGGSDPSATSPVLIPFRSSAIGSGVPSWRAVTSATSITIPNGQVMGTANNVPFRIWVVALDNGGTVELALINCLVGGASPTQIFPLAEHILQSSSAVSGAASAGVFYSTAARSSLAMSILGYVECTSTSFTAGSWGSAGTGICTIIQLFGPGLKKPGDEVQRVIFSDTAVSSDSTGAYANTTTVASISPTSPANIIEYSASSVMQCTSSSIGIYCGMFRNSSTQIGYEALGSSGASLLTSALLTGLDSPATTSSTSYRVKIKTLTAGNASLWGNGPATTIKATLSLKEIMV